MESAVEQNIKTNNVFSLLKYLYRQHQQNTLYIKRLKALKQIIQQGSLHTYFQPIVDLQTAQTIGFEALNRQHPLNCLQVSTSFMSLLDKQIVYFYLNVFVEIFLYNVSRNVCPMIWWIKTF